MGKCASHQEVNGPSIRFHKDSQERGLLRGQQGDFAPFGDFWTMWPE